jgi:predicted hydrocarbon binding protein
MDRKQFLKNCACGLCSCTAVSFLSPLQVIADEPEQKEDWRFPFIKKRYAKLFEILSEKMSEEDLTETFIQLGRFCASTFQLIEDYQGNIDGFIDEFEKRSGENIKYDREKGRIKVIGSERTGCFCPLVDEKLISTKVCDCSLGWQQYTYETLLGKSVEVELLESVLKGSTRCVFQINIAES